LWSKTKNNFNVVVIGYVDPKDKLYKFSNFTSSNSCSHSHTFAATSYSQSNLPPSLTSKFLDVMFGPIFQRRSGRHQNPRAANAFSWITMRDLRLVAYIILLKRI
jgi:hypothetical protein